MEAAQLQSKVCVQSSHVQEPQKPKNLGWGSMEVYNKKIYIYMGGGVAANRGAGCLHWSSSTYSKVPSASLVKRKVMNQM